LVHQVGCSTLDEEDEGRGALGGQATQHFITREQVIEGHVYRSLYTYATKVAATCLSAAVIWWSG